MHIDLTVPLNNQTPIYPGDTPFNVKPSSSFDSGGFNDSLLTTGNHVGTHIDAPSHMLKDGKALSEFGIEHFIGPGRLVEVADGQFSLETVKKAEIQPGDIVLFHTGMSQRFHEPDYYTDHPAMSVEIAQYLVDRKVKLVGLDTGSADNADGFPVHKLLLAGDVLIIENLTNLEKLRGQVFTVYALPIKLDVDGAPARVMAELH